MIATDLLQKSKGVYMKILFCGGGTGGHITPALAIAEEFKKRYEKCDIAFVGRQNGNENKLITNEGYTVYEIDVRGFSRKISLENLKTVTSFLKAKRKAKEILNNFNPDAVIGTGGYVSAPVICAAKKAKIPSFIHESNASLGLTTKLVAKKCKLLMLGANIKTKYKNAIYTGNPVSDKFSEISKSAAKEKLKIPKNSKLIISVGGSLGANKLNETIIDFINNYVYSSNQLYHIHSCGKRYYNKIKNEYPSFCKGNGRIRIMPFVYDMPTYLSAADIVISRCGAMTLAEISKTGRPVIMIPSPNVADNHQMKNALYFKSGGAGEILEENELNTESLIEIISNILGNDEKLQQMSLSAKKLYARDSKEKIVALVVNLIKK